ncbi:MAG TPA: hypothetical protein VIU33_07345 [Nitrospiria bacterium]
MNTRFTYWSCPDCVHAQTVDMKQMTNRCGRIDQGESPIDGTSWEYRDKDSCPGFEASREVVNL